MAKGKSLPHRHSNPGHAGPSHLLTCLYTWQRGGRSNVRSWLRSWIRREAASKAPRVRARERMRRRSCLRIKSRAACGRTASHEPARWSLGGPVVSRGSRRALPVSSPCHTWTRTQSRPVGRHRTVTCRHVKYKRVRVMSSVGSEWVVGRWRSSSAGGSSLRAGSTRKHASSRQATTLLRHRPRVTRF